MPEQWPEEDALVLDVSVVSASAPKRHGLNDSSYCAHRIIMYTIYTNIIILVCPLIYPFMFMLHFAIII